MSPSNTSGIGHSLLMSGVFAGTLLTLAQELAFVDRYLKLQAVRFEHRMQVSLTSDPEVDDVDWIGAAGVYLELHAGKVTHLTLSPVFRRSRWSDPGRWCGCDRRCPAARIR